MPYTQPDGYLAIPPAGKGNAVLALHAWWGLNDTMKAFCTRLAEVGFVAFAPLAPGTGFLNRIACRHSTRRRRAWRGIEPWPSGRIPPPCEFNLRRFAMPGTVTSAAEVTHVSKHGFWLLLGNEELLLPFETFPWFKKATIEQLEKVE